MENSNAYVTKETKNSIHVDYEGKLSFKERMMSKLKTGNTWIKVAINVIRFILMLGVSYVILYPFFSRIAGSFMTKEDIVDSTVSLIPKHFTLDTYKFIITENHYFSAFFNTLLISLVCALLQTLVACLIGYGLAKFKFKGNTLIMLIVVVSMIIPHRTLQYSIAPHFINFDILTVQAWGYKGPIELILGKTLILNNSMWPLIILSITGLAFKNGLYIYLMRQFFKGVPDELEESAYVDGSGVFRTFFQIILPLSVPMMITIFLFSFSWQWTDEFYTGLFWSSADFYLMSDVYGTPPDSLLQYQTFAGWGLYQNVIQNTAGMLIIAPLLILYLFCQKYLVQGIERSGLVG
ncbi:MAG: carbohydrate ABC transporter permease [Clostridia bacterium]|nr:carbohydrate ABC transporter permease [Clostridia bacterium]